MEKEPTTERLTAENQYANVEAYLLYCIHAATYTYCIPLVNGKHVLDYGCGTGYGTALISKKCSQIIGIDIADEAIDYATSHYQSPTLSYLKIQPAEAAPLPFPDSTFDVVISFQVIEHVINVSAYLKEISRVLVPGGQIVIATPDRFGRLFSFQQPWNIWHLREYSGFQLQNVLSEHFSNVKIMHIGGNHNVLKLELSRTRKLKWMTLPFTLPFIPEFIRKTGLGLMKNLRYNFFSKKKSHTLFSPNFDETVVNISNNELFSVGLVAVANKNN
jgi:2-polyprenyl-3-methyl-5-hydroxy-6-metoxy-1,4-benzoquinol methylase